MTTTEPSEPAAQPLLIGLGSNLGERLERLRLGISSLATLPGAGMVRTSSVYETPPFGGIEQPPFLNAVALLTCTLPPLQLLCKLKSIEREAGRDPGGIRWGPRALDLDILSYGCWYLRTPELNIPHLGLAERAFVLVPLVELVGDRPIPGAGFQAGGAVTAAGDPPASLLLAALTEAERSAILRVAPPF